ncbi:hypothetical protein L1F06_020370 [Ectopseudomonas hydrolytica]|uniref:Uncharacterized protein n=2 Tax=Ectopseudomonas TaxID=3236654 RepID=A4XYI9_ECTM1|nr:MULTISPECIES: hypothetical protein [Pseudomonas]ARS50466.1 hypothetical protein PSMEN_19485 [Pseudomonas mendocina]EJO95667.1 hypothetical protein A471_02037 [Pseudomonas mendocina DLHK]MBA4244647.1 hypothetical protein [Pseudomonas sp.]MBF8163143.1 hypothetical protein [Pseudomonas mendocina]MDH0095103.1 hypothetical protein [Pseudomonas sp. GD04158]
MSLTLARPLLWPLAILLLVWLPHAGAAELFYLGQRIPDIHKPWRAGDYQQLREALEQLDSTQANALPRRSGEFTGPIYQRMISTENFRPQLNIYAPLELRQNEAREVLFELKELMRLYFDFRAKQQPYAAEALGLMSYSLRQQAILFTLTTEFWMTLSQSEQSNPVRLQGLQETKAAAAMLSNSALDYLELTQAFGRDELLLYSAELSQQLPELYVHLPADVQAGLLKRIEGLASNHRYPQVGNDMAALLPVLQMIHRDVQTKLAQPVTPPIKAPTLDLSLPGSAQ